VNGILAGQPVCQESFLPVEVDATDLLQPGENVLTLWCGDWERIPTQTGDKVLTPNGSWFAGLARGPWQDVFLETRPAVRIEEIYVQTSVRKSCLSVQIRLENHTQSSTEGRILTQVYDDDQPVRELIRSSIQIKSDEITEVNLEIPWEGARFWSPESPHLYYLIVKLNSSQGEDTRLVRFGFREFWIEGENFFLNG
jgi:beta-galactosidase/beta-glucuronidase